MVNQGFFEKDRPLLDITHKTILTFHKHLHKNVELGYVLSGRTKLRVNAVEHEVNQGDLFLIMPYQTHSFEDHSEEPLNAVVIIFDDALTPAFKTMLNHQSPVTPVFRENSEEIAPIIKKIADFNISDLKYKEQIISGYLSILLGLIAEKQNFVLAEDNSDSELLQKILIYCSENFKESLSLESVAKALGISKSYVSQIFNNSLKVSFRVYINQFRIHEAISLMENTPLSLADIAFESGFQSIRSFNRNFYEYLGVSPTDYLVRLKSSGI